MFFKVGLAQVHLSHQTIEDANRSIGQQILNSYEAKVKERHLQNVRMLLQEGDAAQRIMETANEIKCGLLIIRKSRQRRLQGIVTWKC